MVGYENSELFRRPFKRCTGLSPGVRSADPDWFVRLEPMTPRRYLLRETRALPWTMTSRGSAARLAFVACSSIGHSHPVCIGLSDRPVSRHTKLHPAVPLMGSSTKWAAALAAALLETKCRPMSV